MAVQRLNHAVLYVRDVERPTEFYGDVLGFRVVMSGPGAAFLQAPDSTNDHDLGVFQIGCGAAPSEAGRSTVGLYHLAWEVDTLGELQRLADLLGTRRTRRCQRPRHHQEPVREGSRRDSSSRSSGSSRPHLLTPDDLAARTSIGPLDLPAEIARFGARRTRRHRYLLATHPHTKVT